MKIYEIKYNFDNLPNTTLQKMFMVCHSYTEVDKILKHNGIDAVQSITYLGLVFNSEVLKDGSI